MDNSVTSIIEVNFEMDNSTLCGLTHSQNSSSSEEVILCLHGWLDNAASFIPLLNYLSSYNVIAIDLPGHGKSSHRSQDAHYHFIDWIYDVLSLIELNQWSKVHLVGHSMGGMISSAFTAAFPEKVRSLTLIDSIGFIYGKEKETTEQLRKGMLSRLKVASTSSKPRKKLTLDKATKARLLISDLDYENAKCIVTRNLVQNEDGYRWLSDKRLNSVSPYRYTLAQAEQLVSDISVPTQVLYGSNGLEFVRDGVNHFSSMMPRAKLVEIEGGHHFHMENPEATAILIKELISKSSV